MVQPWRSGWGLRVGQNNVLGPLRYWFILTDRAVVSADAHDPPTWRLQRNKLRQRASSSSHAWCPSFISVGKDKQRAETVCLSSQSRAQSLLWVKSQWQKFGIAGHVTSTIRKGGRMNARMHRDKLCLLVESRAQIQGRCPLSH